VEDHLLQLRRHRRIRGTTDRRLGYAVGDLRGEREQRLDGRQWDPERCDSVHVVLLPGSGADTGRACGLHTHKLWQSNADTDGDSYGDRHGDGFGYTDGNGYCNSYSDGYGHGNSHADSYAYGHSDSYAYADSNTNGDSNSYTYTLTYANRNS
jgi:hypothetical protein